MLKIQTLLLVLGAGSLDAWWFGVPVAVTKAPAATTPAGTIGANTTVNGTTQKMEEEEDDNLSGVGEEIVATGIRKFVEAWDVTPTPTSRTTNGSLTEMMESANPNMTGNAKGEGGDGFGMGVSGSGSGSDPGSHVEGDKILAVNLTRTKADVSKINETVEGVLDSTLTPPDSRINGSDPHCLPVPSDWPICSGKRPKSFTLPNFLNHTSVEEVGAVLQEWAWLTRARCHHSAGWFLCLLLAPRCPSTAAAPLHLPCRSFCQVLQDSCWPSLENGRLPVECSLLPETACASVSNLKGNPGGLECIPSGGGDTF